MSQLQLAIYPIQFTVCILGIFYQSELPTVQWKFCQRKKLANLVNREPFAKIFLANIHRYTENVYSIITDCCLFTKFFLANSFYLHGLPKFSTPNISCVWYSQLFINNMFALLLQKQDLCNGIHARKSGDHHLEQKPS